MKRNSETTRDPETVLSELQSLVAEAEKVVVGSTNGDEAMASLRERFADARERFGDLYDGARKKVIAGAKSTDQAIRSNPYQSLAAALGVGLLLGIVIGRKK